MIGLPLVFGIGALVGAVMLYPKATGERASTGQKVATVAIGCFGMLLITAALGVGACWGFMLLA